MVVIVLDDDEGGMRCRCVVYRVGGIFHEDNMQGILTI
jgi:hypothetical protein